MQGGAVARVIPVLNYEIQYRDMLVLSIVQLAYCSVMYTIHAMILIVLYIHNARQTM